MPSLVMLDSGAFTVWTKGQTVNLEDYAAFCRSVPDVDVYVNLDVIPGHPQNDKRPSAKAIESACRQGWDNYQRLCEMLPREKVLPVYHWREDVKWLKKYLDSGVSYLGVSAGNRGVSNGEKKRWLASIRPLLFKPSGEPRVRIHGFAVDSLRLMNFWQWYSVDSAGWGLMASYGTIAVPSPGPNGTWEYGKCRHSIKVSFNPSAIVGRKGSGFALSSSSFKLPKFVQDYLDFCGASVGVSEIKQVHSGYKLKPGELWASKRNRRVLVVIEPGVSNDFVSRAIVNARFPIGAERETSVEHVYHAGNFGLRDEVERIIRKRLMTFVDMKSQHARRVLRKHCKRARRTNAEIET